MSTTTNQVIVITHTPAFSDGFTQGRQGFYRAINIGKRMKEDVIVGIVRNLTEIAVEGWLSEDLLRRDVGILARILTNCTSMVQARKRYFTFLYEGQKRGVDHEGYIAAGVNFPHCYFEPACPIGV